MSSPTQRRFIRAVRWCCTRCAACWATKKFWAGIRLYSIRFRNANATTDDFRHAMEDACQASGDCPQNDEDLSWFFHEWLNLGGILELKGSWHYDPQAKRVLIALDQTQHHGLYRMPIAIGITLATSSSQPQPANGGEAKGSARQTLSATMLIDKQHNELSVPLDAEPIDVQVDPDLWVPLSRIDFEKQ